MNANTKMIQLNASTGFQPIKVYSNVGISGTIKANGHMNIDMTLLYVYRPGFSNFIKKISSNDDISAVIDNISKGDIGGLQGLKW